MSADVSRVLRPQAALHWVILIVLTGCATAPATQAPSARSIPSSLRYRLCTPQDSPDTSASKGQSQQTCVAMICRDPDDLATCYCPATLPDGSRQPLSPEACKSTLQDPSYDHQFDAAVGSGGGGKGERGKTAKPDGTDNPFKHTRPHPTKKGWIQQKDSHTGQWKDKPAPPGWQEWWDARQKQ